MPALKVYRTPIGFHDAYVAATSQKAALKAWGSDADLFARGVAEVVTDAALTVEPLARPGEIVKRLRGSVEEQLAAAPVPTRKDTAKLKAKPARPAAPRPTRDAVEAAEAALAQAEEAQKEKERELAAEEMALAKRRRTLRSEWITHRQRLEEQRDAAAERYTKALEAWRAG